MSRALLIGATPGAELGYAYVQSGAYDAVVIGSLSLSELLRFREERVLAALAEGKAVKTWFVWLSSRMNSTSRTLFLWAI